MFTKNASPEASSSTQTAGKEMPGGEGGRKYQKIFNSHNWKKVLGPHGWYSD
jgi:hypothetical protein